MILSVYPNPAKNFLTIESIEAIHEISIIDISGSVILVKKENANPIQVDISALQKGIYFLKNQKYIHPFH
jgi:uncharacterized protein YlzI (FlbEa/FlbD family)